MNLNIINDYVARIYLDGDSDFEFFYNHEFTDLPDTVVNVDIVCDGENIIYEDAIKLISLLRGRFTPENMASVIFGECGGFNYLVFLSCYNRYASPISTLRVMPYTIEMETLKDVTYNKLNGILKNINLKNYKIASIIAESVSIFNAKSKYSKAVLWHQVIGELDYNGESYTPHDMVIKKLVEEENVRYVK